MGDLARDMKTLFEAVDPLHLQPAGREDEYDRAVVALEHELTGKETPQEVNQKLEDVFGKLYGPWGSADFSYLAHEITQLMGSLGI